MNSSNKEILFEDSAREKLKKGINVLSEVSKLTYGPKGRNVAMHKFGFPSITNDSNDLINEIKKSDPFINMGISFGKQAANKMKDTCGDGTTTCLILLQELVNQGFKNIAAGNSPVILKKGMEKALFYFLEEIKKMKKDIKTEDILNIATIASSGNKEIGKNISSALDKTDKSNLVSIELGNKSTTYIETSEGYSLDRGYISPYLCTNSEKMNIEMESAYVLITDKKISSIQEILPLLKDFASTQKELLIIANDIEQEALSTLIINKMQKILKVAIVKYPSFGEQRKAILEDIAIFTNGTFISEDKGLSLQNVTIDDLGRCEKIEITKENTVLINDIQNNKRLKDRILEIDNTLKAIDDEYEINKLKERKAKLLTKASIIKVGAPTESEAKQKKQLYEDSLNSTQAALEEGIIVGGAVSFIKASKSIKTKKYKKDEKIGASILIESLKAPLRQLIENSGNEPGIIINQIENSKKSSMGFNVFSEKVEDLFKAKVIDPVKVVKNAVINAVSIASIIILSEVLIAEEEKS